MIVDLLHPLTLPVTAPLTNAITAALGGGYAAIIDDAGQLAPYVTFTRSSTATYFDSNGVMQVAAANQPRYDYDPVTKVLRGLLIEEQRTNALTRSQEFDNAAWGKYRATITPNAATAPDGTLTADALFEDNGTVGTHIVSRQAYSSQTVGTLYAVTFYAKANTRTWVALVTNSVGDGEKRTTFDLTNGVVGTVGVSHTASIRAVGNGWYRCTVLTSALFSGVFECGLCTAVNSTTTSFAGDPTKSVYIWGAQLETGTFATSYIPTTTAAVTRAADTAVVSDLSSIGFNSALGSFFVEADTAYKAGSPLILTVSDNTANNRARMFAGDTSHLFVQSGGVTQADLDAGGITDGIAFKLAVALSANDFSAVLGGGAPATDTSGLMPVGLNKINIGSLQTGTAGILNGHIRRLRYYPRRLSNAQLQALTA